MMLSESKRLVKDAIAKLNAVYKDLEAAERRATPVEKAQAHLAAARKAVVQLQSIQEIEQEQVNRLHRPLCRFL